MNPDAEPQPWSDDESEPLTQLRDLEQETSGDFVGRVQRSIQRRTAASQFATFSWSLPPMLLREMAEILRSVCSSPESRKDPKP